VEDGNPELIGGLLNYRKRQLEHDIIVHVLSFKDTNYSLKLVRRSVYLALTCHIRLTQVRCRSIRLRRPSTRWRPSRTTRSLSYHYNWSLAVPARKTLRSNNNESNSVLSEIAFAALEVWLAEGTEGTKESLCSIRVLRE